jgi:hypothetical protein
MNCFDCASLGHRVPAVGICSDCGAGICADHLRLSPHWLTRTAIINRVVAVEPPARILRCPVCQAAHEAAEAGHYRQVG